MTNEFFDDEGSIHLFQLVHMLQRSAMMHMGLLQDSEGRVHYNLGETKAAIDTLSMMKTNFWDPLTGPKVTFLHHFLKYLVLHGSVLRYSAK